MDRSRFERKEGKEKNKQKKSEPVKLWGQVAATNPWGEGQGEREAVHSLYLASNYWQFVLASKTSDIIMVAE